MKNTGMVLLIFAASAPSSFAAPGTLSGAMDIAKKKLSTVHARQKQWGDELFTAGRRCIQGWDEKYEKAYGANLKSAEAHAKIIASVIDAQRKEIQFVGESAVPAPVRPSEACSDAGKSALEKARKNLAAVEDLADQLDVEIAGLSELVQKSIDKFHRQAVKDVKPSFACPSVDVYVEAAENAFGPGANPNAKDQDADNAFYNLSKEVLSVQDKVYSEHANLKSYVSSLSRTREKCGAKGVESEPTENGNGSAQ